MDRGRQGDRRGRPDRRRRWRRGRRNLRLVPGRSAGRVDPPGVPIRIPPPRGPPSSSTGRAARQSSPTPNQHRNRRRDLPIRAVTVPARVRPRAGPFHRCARINPTGWRATRLRPGPRPPATRSTHRTGERQQEVDREDTPRPAEGEGEPRQEAQQTRRRIIPVTAITSATRAATRPSSSRKRGRNERSEHSAGSPDSSPAEAAFPCPGTVHSYAPASDSSQSPASWTS